MCVSSPPRRRPRCRTRRRLSRGAHHHRFSPWALQDRGCRRRRLETPSLRPNRPVSGGTRDSLRPFGSSGVIAGVMSQLLHISANRPQCVGSQVGDCRIAVYRHQQFSLRQDGSQHGPPLGTCQCCPVGVRASDTNRRGSHGQSLDHIGTRPNPRIEQDRNVSGDAATTSGRQSIAGIPPLAWRPP